MARATTLGRIVHQLRQPGVSTVVVYAAALACVPLAFAVYWPTLGDYFLRDDFNVLRVARNRPFWEVIYRAFTYPEFEPFDEVTLAWRPLTDIYFLGARMFGLHPEPYHAVNILLHGLVGTLTIVFVWRLTASAASGVAAGLLFTVTPTYDFAVTWVSQVSEMFGALMILSALLVYLRYLRAGSPRALYVIATLIFTMLALLSKQSNVILVVLLPALALALPAEQMRRSRPEIVRSLVPVAVMGVIFALAMLVRAYTGDDETYGPGTHMWSNLRDYLEWMVFPYPTETLDALRVAGSIAFVLLGAIAWLLRKRFIAFFAFWTLLALIPFTAFESHIELRYTYQATLPFVAFVVAGVVASVKVLPRQLRAPCAAALVLAVGVALVVTPFRTNDQQGFIAQEAAGYKQMVSSVQDLCGPLRPRAFVFVVFGPYGDLFGKDTQSALNLYYDQVNAARVSVLPLSPLIQLVEEKCVIQYDPALARYVRTQ